MTEPIEIRIDREHRLGYILYVEGAEVAGTIDVWHDGWVAADVDKNDRVLGIEVLGLDNETLAEARKFAAGRNLVFPDL